MTTATVATAVGVAGPAHADNEACTTATSLTINGKTAASQAIVYGQSVGISVTVTATCPSGDPNYPASGRLRVARTTDGGNTWTVIKTVQSPTDIPSGTYFAGRYATKNTYFQAAYDSGTDATANPWNDTFASSASSVKFVGVYRNLKKVRESRIRGGKRITYKALPGSSLSGLKVTLKRRIGTSWKTVATVRANSQGAFTANYKLGVTRVYLPSGRGYLSDYWKITVYRY
ncbi:MAG TPA: hypothetical protein VJ872_20055 [Nocardioides sp.]|nr:hypothetical protein [Nocardioides sp.]